MAAEHRQPVLLALLLSLLAGGCSGNSTPPLKNEVTEQTVVVPKGAMEQVVARSADGRELTFDSDAPVLVGLALGDILVSGDGEGFIGVIRAINAAGGQTTLVTEAAPLEAVLKQGTLTVEQVLAPANLQQAASKLSGVSVQRKGGASQLASPASSLSIVVDLVDVDLGDGITASGKITLEPKVDLRATFAKSSLKTMRSTVTVKQTVELSLTAGTSVALASKEVSLASYTFAPIPVPVVAPLVVPVVPQLEVKVGVNATLEAGIATSYTDSATVTYGLEYTDGAWQKVKEFSNENTFSSPAISATGRAKAYAKLEFALRLLGIAGPFVNGSSYLELELDLLGDQCWKLYAGLEANAGANVRVFSDVVADYSATLVDTKELMAQCESGALDAGAGGGGADGSSPTSDGATDAMPEDAGPVSVGTPCPTRAWEYSWGTSMKFCAANPGRQPNMCNAADLCGEGWHLCTPSEYDRRSSGHFQSGGIGWLDGCIRENGVLLDPAPRDGMCADCDDTSPGPTTWSYGCGDFDTYSYSVQNRATVGIASGTIFAVHFGPRPSIGECSRWLPVPTVNPGRAYGVELGAVCCK